MTETDTLLQGFRAYLMTKQGDTVFANRCVNAMQKRILPETTLDELRTTPYYTLADRFSNTAGGKRYCRIIIRKFQEYLQEANA